MSKKKLAEQARATFKNVNQALTELIAAVPEAHHAVLNGAIASVNTSIAGLEKVTDEDEAGAGIALAAFESLTKQLLGVADQLKAAFTAETAALPGKITAALNAKIAAGELVEKDKVDTLVTAARNQGAENYKAELAKQDSRKTVLATNGIPVSDAALAGTDEEFNARVQTVKPRVEKFKTIQGVDLTAEPITRALFADDATFNKDFEFFQKNLKPAAGGRPNPLAGGKPKTDKPLLVGV